MATYDPYHVDVARMLAELGLAARWDGESWVGRCPSGDHADRKPSWHIYDAPGNEKHGLHWCFSCKFGGTAIELVSHVLGYAQLAAAGDWLAEHASGTAPLLARVRIAGREIASPVLRLPAGVRFSDWPEGPRRYVESRGITRDQVMRWRIGYALSGRLMGRIVFPVLDRAGRLLHYTARTYVGDSIRYLSAKAEEGPDPGAVFGEAHWASFLPRSPVVVTEGAINALAVERVVALPVASLFGSNVDVRQLAKLSAWGGALLVTDPDFAGDRAAEELSAALGRFMRVVRVRLPEGTDAATVPPALLRSEIGNATPFLSA